MKNNIVIRKVKGKAMFWMISYSTFLSSSDVRKGKSRQIWFKELQKRDDGNLKYHWYCFL